MRDGVSCQGIFLRTKISVSIGFATKLAYMLKVTSYNHIKRVKDRMESTISWL